jgi:hypothetical protein
MSIDTFVQHKLRVFLGVNCIVFFLIVLRIEYTIFFSQFPITRSTVVKYETITCRL